MYPTSVALFTIFVGGLVALLVFFTYSYLQKKSQDNEKESVIPGLKPRCKLLGNQQNIAEAGSFHEFLIKLHKEFGPIASFWLGEHKLVSTASPSLWKDFQGLSNRPNCVFATLEPLITKYAIAFVNGEAGIQRHKLISSMFGYNGMNRYYSLFVSAGEEIVKEWDSLKPDEHIDIQKKFISTSVDLIMLSTIGPYFKDKMTMDVYKDALYTCWTEMEKRLDGIFPEEGSERDVELKKSLATIKRMITDAVEKRKTIKVAEDERNLTDVMFEAGYEDEALYGDLTESIAGGFDTSAILMTWSIYYMTKFPEIQDKVYNEMKEILGEETIIPEMLRKLTYTKQVLDETVRYISIVPYTARFSEFDMKIGDFVVPKQTPIIAAHGVVNNDPKYWSAPERFDPDRFKPEVRKKNPSLLFEPFGFAGKRKCPGYQFGVNEATVLLSILLHRFKFHLVEGQEIRHVYSLTTHPDKPIYFTISKR